MDGHSRRLGRVFRSILSEMKHESEQYVEETVRRDGVHPRSVITYYRLFSRPVPRAVEDYNDFIPRQHALSFDILIERARAGRYHDVDAFRADIDRIVRNCERYNDPETGGLQRTPIYIEYARRMREYVEHKLWDKWYRIEAILLEAALCPRTPSHKDRLQNDTNKEVDLKMLNDKEEEEEMTLYD